MKNNRRELILKLIEEMPIETQEDLINELNKHGFNVTQSTVSRDIKLLGLIKVQDANHKYRYAAPRTGSAYELQGDDYDRLLSVFQRSVIRYDRAMNDVIVKCYAGMAQGACVALESLFEGMFVGALAGEDTILIISQDENRAKQLMEKIAEVMR